MVFVNQKKGCDVLYKALDKLGVSNYNKNINFIKIINIINDKFVLTINLILEVPCNNVAWW